MLSTFLAGWLSFTNVCFSQIIILEWDGEVGGRLPLPEIFQPPLL